MAEPIQKKVTARHRPHNMLFKNHTIHRLTSVFNDFGEVENLSCSDQKEPSDKDLKLPKLVDLSCNGQK